MGRVGAGTHPAGQILGKAPRPRAGGPSDSRVTTRWSTSTNPASRPQASHPETYRRFRSTKPLERLNKEIKRRTDVVGTFPNPAALLRLAAHVLIEQHDEWDSAERRCFSENSMRFLDLAPEEEAHQEPTAA